MLNYFFGYEQENVLAESRMMIPDCRKRLEASLEDLKGILVLFVSCFCACCVFQFLLSWIFLVTLTFSAFDALALS